MHSENTKRHIKLFYCAVGASMLASRGALLQGEDSEPAGGGQPAPSGVPSYGSAAQSVS